MEQRGVYGSQQEVRAEGSKSRKEVRLYVVIMQGHKKGDDEISINI